MLSLSKLATRRPVFIAHLLCDPLRTTWKSKIKWNILESLFFQSFTKMKIKIYCGNLKMLSARVKITILSLLSCRHKFFWYPHLLSSDNLDGDRDDLSHLTQFGEFFSAVRNNLAFVSSFQICSSMRERMLEIYLSTRWVYNLLWFAIKCCNTLSSALGYCKNNFRRTVLQNIVIC